MELFSNLAQTTLNGAIDGITTSVVVANGAVFPSTGNFRVVVDKEVMLVTSRTGNTLTVQRGAEFGNGSNTGGVPHVDKSFVTHVITAGALAGFRADTIVSNPAASLPSPGVAGRLYLASDGNYIYQDNGTFWNVFGPNYPFTAPSTSQFAWVNQGSSTASTSSGVLFLSSPSEGTTNTNQHIYQFNTPIATPYTVTVGMKMLMTLNYNEVGLALTATGNSKYVTMGINFQGSTFALPCKHMSSFSAASQVSPNNPWPGSGNGLVFLRISDSGSIRTYAYSFDGINYTTVTTEATGTFVTPTNAGIYLTAQNVTYGVGATIYHWSVTSP